MVLSNSAGFFQWCSDAIEHQPRVWTAPSRGNQPEISFVLGRGKLK